MKNENMLKSTLFVFLIAALVANAAAEHQEGAVSSVRWQPIAGGNLLQLHVLLDTTGNRIADTILRFRDDYVADNLKIFIEKGMIATFDDEDYEIYNGMKYVGGINTKTLDGSNMLELFPAERERFKFAAQEYDRQKAATPQSNADR
jgi:hypothetical protein